jgi:hypothetical protein
MEALLGDAEALFFMLHIVWVLTGVNSDNYALLGATGLRVTVRTHGNIVCHVCFGVIWWRGCVDGGKGRCGLFSTSEE